MVEGRKLLVARVGDQEMLVGQRIEPKPVPDSWRQYLGEYEIANQGADYKLVDHIKLVDDDGDYVIEMVLADVPAGKMRVILKPLSENEGVLLGSLSDGGETVRLMQQDGEERMLLSGYQFKKIVIH